MVCGGDLIITTNKLHRRHGAPYRFKVGLHQFSKVELIAFFFNNISYLYGPPFLNYPIANLKKLGLSDRDMETNGFRAPSTRKLRLASLPPSALPGHPLLEGSGSLASLSEFVCEVLDEALAFSESAIPTTFQPKGSLKNSSPSTAKVQLLSSDVLKGEAWFARRSEHKDVPSEGTASYQEFENGLYYNHSVHEMDYTPDVFDACKVLDYQDQISQDESFRNWRAVEMESE